MPRTTRSVAFLLISLGTVGALTACGSPKQSAAVAVPTWPTNGTTSTTNSPTDVPSTPETSSAAPGTPAPAVPPGPTSGGGNSGGDNQQDPQGNRGRKCTPGQLSGNLVPGSPGAGQRYATLVVTNTSGSTCTLYGYSGLSLVGGDGRALPTSVQRSANPGPSLIVLDPGRSASENLHWTAVNGPGEPDNGPCEPSPAHLAVIPPDQYSAFSVSWDFGPACQNGRIEASAYH